jgi:hypothetical protein
MTMSMSQTSSVQTIPNGPGAAAVLAAGIGCAAFGIITLAAEASEAFHDALIFYNPTGALSGKTTLGIIIWLVAWFVLSRRWKTETVAMGQINLASFVLLGVSLLLTFPPVWGLFIG